MENPTLEKLSALSARLDLVERLLDEQFMAGKGMAVSGRPAETKE